MENNIFCIHSPVDSRFNTGCVNSPDSNLGSTVQNFESIRSSSNVRTHRKSFKNNSIDVTSVPFAISLDKLKAIKLNPNNFSAPKSSRRDQIHILKSKIQENRILSESINTYKQNSIESNSSIKSLKNSIKDQDLEIKSLKEKLLKLTNLNDLKSCKQKLEEIQSLTKENEDLHKSINSLKTTIKKYGTKKITQKEFNSKTIQLKKIQEKWEQGLNENSKLQQDLIKLKKSNLASGSNKNISLDLKVILSDIMKISYIANGYSEKKSIDFSKLLNQDFYLELGSLAEYIEKIRKSLEGLRRTSTDLYAEFCGSTCTTS